eukprot:6055510-Pyramimonas_sp.AAC.1
MYNGIQCSVKCADVHPPADGPLGAPLRIATHAFTNGELTAASKNLLIARAAGHDGIAPDS